MPWDAGYARSTLSAERNKEPILRVLRRVLPPRGLVLEIASGTGQHVAHFARALAGLEWQPSDPDAGARELVRSRTAGLANVRAPLDLEVSRRPWPAAGASAVLCINMIHVAPWSAAEALVAGAAEALAPGGRLILYGPYRRFGSHTSASNADFDAQLRASDPAWGVRDLEAVEALGRAAGFAPEEIVEMPANNLTVVLRRG